jgi:multicomponent Na+:H+ antiporter subunit C
MSAAVLVGLLATAGFYLILQRNLLRVVIGVALLGHVATVLLLAAGGMDRRGVPVVGVGDAGDPLPQAFALTAVVITFGITVYLLGLCWYAGRRDGDDDMGRRR